MEIDKSNTKLRLSFLAARFLVLLFGFAYTSIASAYYAYPRTWGSAEYLYGWVQNSPISAPLTTENSNPDAFGIINQPGTKIIFGSYSNKNSFNLHTLNGARLTLGGWVDNCHKYGIEASGFDLLKAKSSFSASSVNGKIPIINIPFFSTTLGENVLVNRLPNTVSIKDTYATYGFELNGLYNLLDQPFAHPPLMFIAGFRYLNIHENLRMNDAILQNPSFPNAVVNVNDKFITKNDFYGFQVGIRGIFAYSNFSFDLATKVALGNNYEKLTIKGQTNVNNKLILQPIGLFAEPSNIGSFRHNQIAAIPEAQAKIGYYVTKMIHPFLSYNCIYINNVIRPGRQIDRNINQSQNPLLGGTGVLSGPGAPLKRFHNSGMWMQMLSAGIEFDI